VEGIVGPSVAFLAGRHYFGLLGGIGFAFAWATLCFSIHIARGRRISGLLLIAMITVALRTVAGLIAHSSTAFFIGPDIATAGMGLTFVISALAGRPLIGRVLGDLLPPDWFDPTAPEAARLCRLASLAWGFEQMVASVVTALLLFNLNTTDYVTFHEPISLATFGVVVVAWLPLLLPEIRAVRRHAAGGPGPAAQPTGTLVAPA
jgi:uncharacterized membrane protein